MSSATASIVTSPRSVSPDTTGGGWPIAALLLMSLPFVCFVTPGLPWPWAAPLFVALATLLGRKLPAWRGHALVWGVFGAGLALRVPWPLSLILPVVVVFALRRYFPSLREIAASLRWGRLDAGTCALSAGIVLVSSLALVGWFVWGGADVSDIAAHVPRVSLGLLLLGTVLFSIANALWEELLMKWLVWDGAERLARGPIFTVAFQAALFGLLHYHGFPRGWLGVTLAAVYGVLLGILRLRSGGLLALVVTHFWADVVICVLIWRAVPA